MPIVYVHGVANRLDGDDDLPGWEEIEIYLRRYVAPTISGTPEEVAIEFAYWGDLGANFRWAGISRPRSKLLGQGPIGSARASQQIADLVSLADLPELPRSHQLRSALTSGKGVADDDSSNFRLRSLSAAELSDLLCDMIEQTEAVHLADAKLLSDLIAHDENIRGALTRSPDLTSELEILRQEFAKRNAEGAGLAGQGAGGWWTKMIDRAREVAVRVNSAPAFAMSRLAMELRSPVNGAITTFIGDAFAYLAEKDSVPGSIRKAVLDVIRLAREKASDKNEPMVVVSHSMGGQIVLDLATNYLDEDLRIDFWAAAASQVGLFEELKLFLKSDRAIQGPLGRAPFPPHVGWWWNVWDSNDVLSFTAQGIFDIQVDDEEWNSGASALSAHGAYLRRPSFYRKLAAKIVSARKLAFTKQPEKV